MPAIDNQGVRRLETRSRFLTRGAVAVMSAGFILIVVAAPLIEPPEAPAIWFDDLGPLPAVDDDTLGRYVVSRLPGRGPATAIPAELERDAAPRIVFLSVSDGVQRARIVTGAAKGLGAAIDRAMTEAKNAGLIVDGGWMKVDVVNFVDPEDRLASKPPFPIDLGIHGLAFGGPWGVAFTPDELVSYGLLTGKMDLDGKEMHRYLEYKDPTSARYFLEMLRPRTPVPYRLFTTKSWFIESGEAVPLYRGHRTYESVTATQLRDSAIRGGEYLIRSVRDDGSFAYSYFPVQDNVASSYNMLRHAGTIYAMLELYEVTRNPALLAEAERAIGLLAGKVRPCGEEEQYRCVVDDDAIKLGGNALAIIALTLHRDLTGDDSHRDLMKSMAGWIKSVQSQEGEFVIHKISYPEEVVQDFTSQYYPGETLLALARLYVQERDDSLIESASKGAHWLIDVRDAGKDVDDLAHDHWLLYALNDIFRLTEDPAILEHAMKISEAIVGSQNLDPAFEDWLGSYYRPPRSTPTAIRTEGLAASYALARDFDRPEMAERILDALKLGMRFDLQTQFGPEKAMYFGDPQRAMGGFGKSLTVFEIRIDYVQHNISALLAVADILDERERHRKE